MKMMCSRGTNGGQGLSGQAGDHQRPQPIFKGRLSRQSSVGSASLSPESQPGIDAQLFDDFFGEADEHLIGIRQGLLRLESSVDKAEPELKIVKDLFQNFHSLKGISAIVGLRPAEAVAHATEDFFRLMK